MARGSYALRTLAALGPGGLVAFCEIWTLVPAPNVATLALAAIVPEVTPWAMLAALAAWCMAEFAGRGWPRTIGVAAAALACGCAAVPWILLPGTIARCDAALAPFARTTFGARKPVFGDAVQAQPYSLAAAFSQPVPAADLRTVLDIPVRAEDRSGLRLDLYRPPSPGAHPTVILIYGGAWAFGRRADSAALGRRFAELGYTAIAVDYRHAPAAIFPAQLDDIRVALAAIREHAGAWNVDLRRVGVLGRSAGAQLALLAAYERGPLAIRAVVAYYAPTDLTRGYHDPPVPDPADVRRILRSYLGGSPAERMAAYTAASPVKHVKPGLPPTLLVFGSRDELVRPSFGRTMADALRRTGNQVAELEFAWSNHAFDEIPGGTGTQLARYYTERFLAATL